MAREFFKNLPDTTTPFNAQRMNGFLNGEESIGSIVVEDITCKNLFDKNNFGKLEAYFDSTNLIASSTSNRVLYVKCAPNTTYTIQKAKSAVFIAGYTNELPVIGSTVYGIQDAGTSIHLTLTTGDDAKYIVIRYMQTTQDTLTEQDILNTIQLEKGPIATDYVEHKEFSGKQIYSTNEQIIGTWRDGRTLYRKTLALTPNISASITDTSLSLDFTNINMMLIVPEATYFKDVSNSTGYMPFPNIHGNTNYLVGGYIVVDNGIPILNIRKGSSMSIYSIELTVIYTKNN